MQLTQLEIKRELEQAKREGRWGDVEELEILMSAINGAPPAPAPLTSTYVLQEGDDPFVVSERELGSVEHVPHLLRTNPSSSWTPGTEIELPEIEDEEPNSGALVDLFETIGPPGPNWTADDWAVLDAVREEIEAGQQGDGGGEEGPVAEQAAAGTEAAEEEGDAPAPASGELPPELVEIQLPEEQAQAVAEYLAQMLMSRQLGDPFVVSGGQAPDGMQTPPKLVDTQRQGEYEIDEAKDWLEQWYSIARQDAKLTGADQDSLREQYEEYQAQIAAGQMSADEARGLVNPVEPSTTQYDLTEWLVEDMVATAVSPEVDRIRELNQYFTENPSQESFLGLLGGTFSEFGPWGPKNVKEPIQDELDRAVVLCGESECRWVDYSTPGNILFGYNMARIEMESEIYYVAAGLLQTIEDLIAGHPENIQERWSNESFGDDPFDKAAVDFGRLLYETYGTNLTVEDFKRELTADILDSLQPPPEGVEIKFEPKPQENHYEPGEFDN